MTAHRQRQARWAAMAVAAGGVAGCGNGDETLSVPVAEGLAGVAAEHGCLLSEQMACDIMNETCQRGVAELASCLRHGAQAPVLMPEIEFASEAEIRQQTLDSLSEFDPEAPNPYRDALVAFGLTVPDAFDPDTVATRYAESTLAFYRFGEGQIVIIEHEDPPDNTTAAALLLHEMLHAVQDAKHDLSSLQEPVDDSDERLALSCLIEGEARMYEELAQASLWGLDVPSLDFERHFANRLELDEQWLIEQADVYNNAFSTVPYAHGTDFVHRVLVQEGQPAVLELFERPLQAMRPIMGSVWGQELSGEAGELTTPSPPGGAATAHILDHLGSLGLYLFVRQLPTEDARELALAWRADVLDAFTLEDGSTAARWLIEFADEDAATALADAAATRVSDARVRGRQVLLVSAEGTPPEWLYEAL